MTSLDFFKNWGGRAKVAVSNGRRGKWVPDASNSCSSCPERTLSGGTNFRAYFKPLTKAFITLRIQQDHGGVEEIEV